MLLSALKKRKEKDFLYHCRSTGLCRTELPAHVTAPQTIKQAHTGVMEASS